MAELDPTVTSGGEEAPAPEEESAVCIEASEANEIPPASSDHKRKLEDLEPHEEEGALQKKPVSGPESTADAGSNGIQSAEQEAEGNDAPSSADTEPPSLDGETDGSGIRTNEAQAKVADEETVDLKVDAEQPSLDGETHTDGLAADGGQKLSKLEDPAMENGQHPSTENAQHASAENPQNPAGVVLHEGSLQPSFDTYRKIEVPNNKVGVLIGKSGDTIRSLQINSGAKIQITRDTEADPYSSTRPVELIGTWENINKAEQLIKDVIAESDAGGSPALVAQGFVTPQSGGEINEIQVPNGKVGLIIGKGGETIKNLQTKSGAHIQLIPQHLPEGDVSKERTVRITGNRKQIESAKEMIKEVMNQAPASRPSHLSGRYTQQNFRPRGPTNTLPHWGPRAAAAPTQPTMSYGHQPRGMYPPQTTQYPPQSYSGYSQQQLPPSSSGFSTGWDQQRQAAPVQSTPQTGGYDYYGQGGQASTNTVSSNHHMPTPAPASSPAPVNYNSYVQSQGPGYGHPTPYSQPIPAQQNYGHVYNEPKYDNQAPSQQLYGHQPPSLQPGVYGQQGGAPQPSYAQHQDMAQSYGQQMVSQPGDVMYQGSVPSTYGSSGATQQSYPHGSNVASQPAPAYGQSYAPTSGVVDGYNQPSSAGYPQHGGPAGPGYGQVGQSVPAYTQPGAQPGNYGQYPSQPGYGDQPAPNSMTYGYQGGYDASTAPSSGYGAPPPVSGQPGYAQPTANPSGYYVQPAPPQAGYGGIPGSAPAGYTKSLSPQPGYGGQYDSASAQMYVHH